MKQRLATFSTGPGKYESESLDSTFAQYLWGMSCELGRRVELVDKADIMSAPRCWQRKCFLYVQNKVGL